LVEVTGEHRKKVYIVWAERPRQFGAISHCDFVESAVFDPFAGMVVHEQLRFIAPQQLYPLLSNLTIELDSSPPA
jgi:hypothetical protein